MYFISRDAIVRGIMRAQLAILVVFVAGLVFTYRRMTKRLADETLGEET